MTRRTSAEIQIDIDRLKNLKKEVVAKEKAQERKERTRRLIQRGAILEQYLMEPENLTNEEVSEIVKYAFNTPYVREYMKEIK